MELSNEDIAAELSATFDLGLPVTRKIATWIIEYRAQLEAENERLKKPQRGICGYVRQDIYEQLEAENVKLKRLRDATEEMVAIRHKCDDSPVRFAPVTAQIIDALANTQEK